MLSSTLVSSDKHNLLTMYYRSRLMLVILANYALVFLSYFAALALRFDFDWNQISGQKRLLLPYLLLILSRHICYMRWNLNLCYWRYVSTPDLLRLIKAHTFSTIMFTALVLLFRVDSFPRSVIFIEFVLSIMIQGGARVAVRLLREAILLRFAARDKDRSTLGRHVVVLGAGDSGHLVVKNLLSFGKLRYVPVAVLDDNERYIGTKVHGVSVIGNLTSLEPFLEQHPLVTAVIVAIPSLGEKKLTMIRSICERGNVMLKRLHNFEDIACQDADRDYRPVSIETVLEKEQSLTTDFRVHQSLNGKIVLVTGAGGSIGSEIVRQILNFDPKVLVLLDHSEFNLFKIYNELSEHDRFADVIPVIASIVDHNRLKEVFAEHKPEFVFHAAAYKHVPLMETNVREAYVNNVLGTKRLLDTCVEYRVERLVFISSDKAVAPTSIMGCSKRIGELLVQESGLRPGSSLEVAIVRFGNVINSSGSVIPLWKEQIDRGGPLTITHPDMERYFMSIREAVRLVLMSGVVGDNGSVFVLDMGKPIKIEKVARKMLMLYGRRDIEIVYTGARPGEKLKEELLHSGERIEATEFSGVGRLVETASYQVVVDWVSKLEMNITKHLGSEMFKIVDLANQFKETQLSVAS